MTGRLLVEGSRFTLATEDQRGVSHSSRGFACSCRRCAGGGLLSPFVSLLPQPFQRRAVRGAPAPSPHRLCIFIHANRDHVWRNGTCERDSVLDHSTVTEKVDYSSYDITQCFDIKPRLNNLYPGTPDGLASTGTSGKEPTESRLKTSKVIGRTLSFTFKQTNKICYS